jgi:hypothetical protein
MVIVLASVILAATTGVVALLASGLGQLALDAPRIRRRHRAVKPWPIGEAPESQLGRLSGRVRVFEESLTSPLSGRRCVYYAVVVQGDRKHITECKSVSFVLEDRSGRAIIEPANGTVALTFDHREQTPVFNRTRPEVEALLGRHGIDSRGLFGNKPLKFFEGVVEIGQEVEVVGAGTRETDRDLSVEAGYRDPLPTSLHVTNSVQAPLSISTALTDG